MEPTDLRSHLCPDYSAELRAWFNENGPRFKPIEVSGAKRASVIS